MYLYRDMGAWNGGLTFNDHFPSLTYLTRQVSGWKSGGWNIL